MIRELNPYSLSFPNPRFASDEGIVAFGGDLSQNRLLSAYRSGIFPWYNKEDPILWWSPNPRSVLFLNDFKISKSMAKTIKKGTFEIRFDFNFRCVIENCKKVKRNYTDHTWIQDEIIDAYCTLFDAGIAHSFESYQDGELVGGGYGLVMGEIFCGESMFSYKNDASKIALYGLIERLKNNGFKMIDCQVPSKHLESLGATILPRDEFLDILKSALENP
ncbi:MAG: leucyl/phenylalanyl-tRNA--protein transferase, partial [Epsilonproteobacteria bacterium]|nr:leucyl/phenylalanyl-tRNA--protein transferase [Campylobacterota bacterium]